MEAQKIELVFILDRSGSMGGLENDTIGGFNAFIQRQRTEAGEVTLSTLLFDNQIEVLHDRMSLNALSPLTEKDYSVRGSTALLDAMGYGIQKIIQVQRMSKVKHKADKVLFVITTDGMENASREYSVEQIRQLIETQERDHHWEFVFLGANIDALATARSFGIKDHNAVQYHNDAHGIDLNFKNITNKMSAIKNNASASDAWKKEIEEDFKKRK